MGVILVPNESSSIREQKVAGTKIKSFIEAV